MIRGTDSVAWRLRVAIAIILFVLALRGVASAVSEYALKGAFLYNFAKYVAFPGEDREKEPIVVGFLGRNPFEDVRDWTFEGKTVEGRPVVLRPFDPNDPSFACDILFVPESAEPLWAVVRDGIEKRPILTVGESESFLRRGGILRFALEGQNLRFDVNTPAAKRAGLKLSSQLMKLARHRIEGKR